MKLQNLPNISKITNDLKKKGKKIALCHGCYDFLHVGHVRHLQEVKDQVDILIVSVTNDPYVNKGPSRPIFTALERCEMLAALTCVDYIVINHANTGIPVISSIKPTLYFKGSDYISTDCEEFQAAKAVGSKVCFTETLKYSTTELVERIRK